MQSSVRFFIVFLTIIFSQFPAHAALDNTNTSVATETKSTTSNMSGLTDDEILLGSVLPLDGRVAGIGRKIQAGLSSALMGQSVGDRKIRILYKDDLYEPNLTPLKVERLLKQGIFAMIGNMGTPTAAVALPILDKAGVPAVGFFSGADLLRNNNGSILNYRASYAEETAAVIDTAIQAGLKPEQVCAYVQNDSYGKSGLIGVQLALQRAKAPQLILDGLRDLLAGSTNNLLLAQTSNTIPVNTNGPVGIYIRNRREIMPGYQALKNWEHKTGYHCGLVVTVGIYDNLASFIYSVGKLGEKWIISAVSTTGADDLRHNLQELIDPHASTSTSGDATGSPNIPMPKNIVMSQVVPTLESDLPIVQEARNILGEDFGFVALEGYIVGKMMLEILRDTPPPLTQSAFLSQAKQTHFDLGGVIIDFTRDGNQGSNLVTITKLTDSGYRPLLAQDWHDMLAQQATTLPQIGTSTTTAQAPVVSTDGSHAKGDQTTAKPTILASHSKRNHKGETRKQAEKSSSASHTFKEQRTDKK